MVSGLRVPIRRNGARHTFKVGVVGSCIAEIIIVLFTLFTFVSKNFIVTKSVIFLSTMGNKKF